VISFIDTNILVYSIDNAQPDKQARAIAAVGQASQAGQVVVSTQVLVEFFNIATRKLKPGMQLPVAAQMLERLCEFEVMPTTAQAVVEATHLMQRYQLQWWDALILESALRAGADELLTEDGQHGQRFGSLLVRNPLL
jgi:predicted nucleic acid-binding protein